MTNKLVALAVAVCPGVALAEVDVRVAPGAPFTSTELADAVDLRTRQSGVVEISELEGDEVVVVIGTRARRIALPRSDAAARTRLVAVVVTSMLESETTADAEEPAILRRTERSDTERSSLSFGTSILIENSGYDAVAVTLGLALPLKANVRGMLSASLAQEDDYLDTSSILVPLRAGIEGRSGALALEVGAQHLVYAELSCGSPQLGAATGPYAIAKLTSPVREGLSVSAELGGFIVARSSPTECNSNYNYTSHGGWLGLSAQWAR